MPGCTGVTVVTSSYAYFYFACEASVADLTFVRLLRESFHANVKSKATLEIIFAGVPSVLAFVKVPAAKQYECQNRDTSGRNGRPAFPAPSDLSRDNVHAQLGHIHAAGMMMCVGCLTIELDLCRPCLRRDDTNMKRQAGATVSRSQAR